VKAGLTCPICAAIHFGVATDHRRERRPRAPQRVRRDLRQRRQTVLFAVCCGALDSADEDAVSESISVATAAGAGAEEVIGRLVRQPAGPAVHRMLEQLVAEVERDLDLARRPRSSRRRA